MPGEVPKVNRWEGPHTYKKTPNRKARTVAQLREEAAAKSRASREETISRRRGSIGGPVIDLESNVPSVSAAAPATNNAEANLRRRGSTGGIPPPGPNGPGEIEDRDTVREQERGQEMPSAGKKKRNGSGNKSDPEDQANDGVDPALKKFLNAMKNDLMETTKEAVGRLETRLERNEASIASLERRMDQSERMVGEKIATEVAKQCKVVAGKSATPDKREAAYNFCRRSLKMWPVEGELLVDAVKFFLKEKLGMADGRIFALGSIEASIMPSKAARERKEVLVTFESREDRDNVKANGVNLSGRREVGMSLHVPGFLMDNLVALNGLGYAIKQKNPGVKRAVKFDDNKKDLFLDFCLGGHWKRVTPEEAKQVMKEVPTASANSASISVRDLTNLVQGRPLDGLGAVIIPGDDMEE